MSNTASDDDDVRAAYNGIVAVREYISDTAVAMDALHSVEDTLTSMLAVKDTFRNADFDTAFFCGHAEACWKDRVRDMNERRGVTHPRRVLGENRRPLSLPAMERAHPLLHRRIVESQARRALMDAVRQARENGQSDASAQPSKGELVVRKDSAVRSNGGSLSEGAPLPSLASFATSPTPSRAFATAPVHLRTAIDRAVRDMMIRGDRSAVVGAVSPPPPTAPAVQGGFSAMLREQSDYLEYVNYRDRHVYQPMLKKYHDYHNKALDTLGLPPFVEYGANDVHQLAKADHGAPMSAPGSLEV